MLKNDIYGETTERKFNLFRVSTMVYPNGEALVEFR